MLRLPVTESVVPVRLPPPVLRLALRVVPPEPAGVKSRCSGLVPVLVMSALMKLEPAVHPAPGVSRSVVAAVTLAVIGLLTVMLPASTPTPVVVMVTSVPAASLAAMSAAARVELVAEGVHSSGTAPDHAPLAEAAPPITTS